MKKILLLLAVAIIMLFSCEKENNTDNDAFKYELCNYVGTWSGDGISIDIDSTGSVINYIYELSDRTVYLQNQTSKIDGSHFEINGDIISIEGTFTNSILFTGNYSYNGKTVSCNLNLQFSVDVAFENCTEFDVANGFITISTFGLEKREKKYSIDGVNFSTDNSYSDLEANTYNVKIKDQTNTVVFSDNYYIFEESVLKDTRDNKDYRILKIKDNIWMAENLNFDLEGSVCYENLEQNCDNYGKLYSWNQAVNIVELTEDVCPTGWHIPDKSEWQSLLDDYPVSEFGVTSNVKGMHFNVGGMQDDGTFLHKGIGFRYWSSTQTEDKSYAYTVGVIGPFDISFSQTDTSYYSSIRCVKD